jgi:hypothetical protein
MQDRIRDHTSDRTNRSIDHETMGAIDDAMLTPGGVEERLAELDREWDVDRALMLNFGIVGALSAWKGRRSRAWGAFFWIQMGFLIHHALRGWCPPMPLFRRLGFRSRNEIAAERVALATRSRTP